MGTPWVNLLLGFCLYFSTVQSEKQLEAGEILRKIQENGYDPRTRPISTKNATAPTEITLSMHVQQFFDLDLNKNEIGIIFYLREEWTDPRLSYSNQGSLVPPKIRFNIHPEHSNIWLPDTHILNEVLSRKPDSKHATVTITSDGLVSYSRLISTTVFLNASLQNFPSVEAHCVFNLESYSHTKNEIDYIWKANGVAVGSTAVNSGFEFKSLRFRNRHVQTSSGDYSRPKADFYFNRSTSPEWHGLYLPTTLIILFSWINFWIYSDRLTAKVIIGSTSLLLLFLRVDHVYKEIPSTTYVKTIDYWIGFCFFLIFLSLFEFVIVAHFAHLEGGTHGNEQKRAFNLSLFDDDLPFAIHILLRYIYLILFVLFVGIYCIIAA